MQSEPCPLTLPALYRNITAGLLQESKRGAETETGTLAHCLRRKERVENLVLDIRWDAHAIVANSDLYIVALDIAHRHAICRLMQLNTACSYR